MKHTLQIIKLIPLPALLMLAACRENVTGEDAAAPADDETMPAELILTDAQVGMAGIQSGRPREMLLADVLSCQGYVRVPPRGQVTVSLPLEAYVREIRFHWGEQIREGEVLAVMEHPEFLKLQQAYIETGNELELLKEDLSRQETLASESAVSEKVLMAARTLYENTRARHVSIGGQLKLLGIDPAKVTIDNFRSRVEVRAPVTGYITHHEIKTGELMQPGDPIAEMIDISGLNLHLVVYEKDAGRVRAGQSVDFTTEAGAKTYRATVHTIGKVIVPGNRSVDVHAHIENPDGALLAGMYVRAGILTGQKEVIALPEPGVVTETGQDFVFTREGNTFRKIAVQTGMRRDGFVEILAPEILPDADLVTAGAYYLNAEMSQEEE